MMMRAAPLASATAAVVKVRKTSMIATLLVARVAPSRAVDMDLNYADMPHFRRWRERASPAIRAGIIPRRCRSLTRHPGAHEKWRGVMSYELADHPAELPRRATMRALKKFASVLIVASPLSACAGGAGLDVPMKSVDHGCHSGAGVVLGGEGSGCS
jgi:hypothetical protein